MTPFSTPWPNPDLDIHPDPLDGWHRIAVCSQWDDAKSLRKKYPEAAVIGPLRSPRGLDLMVRSLLANPQIRVLIIDGTDRIEGDPSRTMLEGLFRKHWQSKPDTSLLDDDVIAPFLEQVNMIDLERDGKGAVNSRLLEICRINYRNRGEALFLPPPAPKPSSRAPHGDAGERIAGETLSKVWPQTLRRILECGREIPTQYGMTREIAGLVTVIRDPRGDLPVRPGVAVERAGLAWNRCPVCKGVGTVGDDPDSCAACNGSGVDAKMEHPVLGFSWARLESYALELTTSVKADGAAYSYGSRMAGRSWFSRNQDEATCRSCGAAFFGARDPAPDCCSECGASGVPDQFYRAGELLGSNSLSRAVFLTPWSPPIDSGKESDRPCLVGVQFRARPAPRVDGCTGTSDNGGEAFACHLGAGTAVHKAHGGYCCFGGEHHGTRGSARDHTCLVLDAFVIFRSHDYTRGYPLNLAAVCLWLVRLAEEHGMAVGQVMCTSNSAHLYEHDWKTAQDIVEANKPPIVQWDQRAVWRVELIDPPAMAFEEALEQPAPTPNPKPFLRATALTPGDAGGQIIDTFEAPTPGRLLIDISRSGMVTNVQHALWLGGEIERIWRG